MTLQAKSWQPRTLALNLTFLKYISRICTALCVPVSTYELTELILLVRTPGNPFIFLEWNGVEPGEQHDLDDLIHWGA